MTLSARELILHQHVSVKHNSPRDWRYEVTDLSGVGGGGVELSQVDHTRTVGLKKKNKNKKNPYTQLHTLTAGARRTDRNKLHEAD